MQEERMHEREHMILSFVEDEHYRPMKIKEMAALMNVPKKQRGEFHEVLDRLIAKGKIAINKAKRNIKKVQNTVKSVRNTVKATRKTAKTTIKTTKQVVKNSVKLAQRTAK